MPSEFVSPKLAEAHRYITRHFRENPALADVAAAIGVSPFNLHRRFHRHYGITTRRLTLKLQLEEGKRLMLTGLPLGMVAGRVGIPSQHFCTRFKRAFGLSPLKWLRQQREAGTR